MSVPSSSSSSSSSGSLFSSEALRKATRDIFYMVEISSSSGKSVDRPIRKQKIFFFDVQNMESFLKRKMAEFINTRNDFLKEIIESSDERIDTLFDRYPGGRVAFKAEAAFSKVIPFFMSYEQYNFDYTITPLYSWDNVEAEENKLWMNENLEKAAQSEANAEAEKNRVHEQQQREDKGEEEASQSVSVEEDKREEADQNEEDMQTKRKVDTNIEENESTDVEKEASLSSSQPNKKRKTADAEDNCDDEKSTLVEEIKHV